MTITAPDRFGPVDTAQTAQRFRLHRAGILNVWQYDDQEFLLADGRMLLRGANGAGKSKTLEMLLPFAIDGDKSRITASARHHTSLLWLMTDGYDGQARVGYIWVEFLRPTDTGDEVFTCGVGIRSSASAKTATTWFFATGQRVGHDLSLEDDGGPLSRPRLEEAIGTAGQVFDKPTAYKEHVGRTLFGLTMTQYDEVLRLLYWLRQPQIGEDIEPVRLADQLAQALPQLDEESVKAAGDTFDELTAFGEQIERRSAAAEALTGLAAAYTRYARSVIAQRARGVIAAVKEERRLRGALRGRISERDRLREGHEATGEALVGARAEVEDARSRISELEASPEARDQRRLGDLEELTLEKRRLAEASVARADGSEATHRNKAERQAAATEGLLARLSAHVTALRELDVRQAEYAVDSDVPVPPTLEPSRLESADTADAVADGLARTRDVLTATTAAVGRRRAAVQVLWEAVGRLSEAVRRANAEERRADDAERAWETARERRTDAEQESDELAVELRGALSAWVDEENAPAVELPKLLTPESVATVRTRAHEAAEPVMRRLREESQQVATRVANASERITQLEADRARIEAEHDPAPPTPTLPRSHRTDGAGLWRLVDFAEQVTDVERAGIEAALQASGLLDAWVRPDGRLLDAATHDVLLTRGVALTEATLADVLRPDPPSGSDVDSELIADLLGRIRLVADADRAEESVAVGVGVDGSWRLASLRGRATKMQAQYVGATARAQERRRRLSEVDESLGLLREELARDERALTQLQEQVAGLERWVRGLPDSTALSRSWTRIDERRDFEQSAESANAEAQGRAHESRATASGIRREVEKLAVSEALPAAADQLSAVEERLRRLDADLGSAVSVVASLERDVQRWVGDHAEVVEAARLAGSDRVEASRISADSELAASRLEELRRTVGATVAELESRLKELRGTLGDAVDKAQRLEAELQRTTEELGSAKARVDQADAELASHHGDRLVVLAAFAAIADVPGLADSAFQAAESPAPAAAVLAAVGQVPFGEPVPTPLVEVATLCAQRAAAVDEADVNLVWKAYTEVVSGPAADHDPSIAEFGDLIAVTGRDDAGQLPVTALAARVMAAVTADRELLTQRERERFEQHILGELGDTIRRCRLEADELVDAMNRLLGGVTTSQGIRVRLQWQLRDDVPAEAREAVKLLGQPVGALLPHERASLRDALHRLIEASRAERPELSYGEHLAAALDYRGWFSFRIRYTRPEAEGTWQDLHRRSALSQGEQKVLCYLPLFAAAAAHFNSLAGAAPHAPRLVLLDDAFPKIDVRTHPLLFGLLVDLDLDFVITSERLWGDHDTVPSLAIYEALRDPAQRGIAQFEYRWDGRQLRSLG
jgi:uncharacterized protein (TIGR02680 family)